MRSLFLVALVSCAEAAGSAPPGTIVVPVQPTAEAAKAAPPAKSAEPAPVVASAPEPDALPPLWTVDAPNVPRLGYREALGRARTARGRWKKLPAPATDDAAKKTWFVQGIAIADEASRFYASAFHADDASTAERVDAITEAAELDAQIARRFDELGLDTMPLAWRTEPAIRASFEDIAEGPARRWRDESRALAKHCIEFSRTSHASADAVARCTVLRSTTGAKVAKGDASPCGCAPGDPLCSASLGGWCKD